MHREGTYVGLSASNDSLLNKENLAKVTPEQKAAKRRAAEEVAMMIQRTLPIILQIRSQVIIRRITIWANFCFAYTSWLSSIRCPFG
jgi:hypothetical protein